MNILMQSRATLFKGPGGDTIQLLKTKEALERLGQQVGVSLERTPDLTGYDLLHLFNLSRPQDIYSAMHHARERGRKVVLSPIHVTYQEYDRRGRTALGRLVANTLKPHHLEYLKVLARALKNREIHQGTMHLLGRGYRRCQLEVLGGVDVLLPNSLSEMDRVFEDFSLNRNIPYVVVPNGVDLGIFNSAPLEITPEVEKFRNCVLCVARIEGGKCQLSLVRAMKGLPYQLVLIGKPAPNHLAYFEQVKKEASDQVYILGEVEHEMLPQYYKVAKVHALVSWAETCGLSSLEAGMMGCNLVITDKGDTRDYYGDYAYYCEPDSLESIRAAIFTAYNSPPNPALKRHIRENFTWEKAAEKTLEGYRMALGS
jgi:glycosyltransferase involved in cell wall biosynthesis